jgi:TolB-like protein/DNA-binding winged helix-turn-helix (wHTH) protein/Tfp pilus assembly protein PilF
MLTPKVFDVLVFLARNPNRVVTKEELLKAVWADTFVEEGNLTQNISLLRKALLQDSGDGELIVTIPRKGYQFSPEVTTTPREPKKESSEHDYIAPPNQDFMKLAAIPEARQTPAGLSSQVPRTPAVYQPRNLRWPMLVSALTVLGLVAVVISWRHFRPRSSPAKIMLAVLPFENLTGDPNQEYFADGLTEELISTLGRLHPEQLGVIARTSVMGYKHSQERLDQIGRDLGVQYVLESSFRRGPDRLRVTVQLVQVKDQTHLWAKDYDFPARELLAVQDDVATEVAREIQLRLTPQEQADLSRLRTIDPEAQEAYLKGRFFWNQRTKQGFESAIQNFQLAIANDPNYAQAYAGLADCYLLLSGYGFEPPNQAMPRAKAASVKAIDLNDRLAEPYTSLGLIALQYSWNWAESEANFKRALQRNANYATAHEFYGDGYLSMAGKTDEAIAELRKAHELDPLSPVIAIDLGRHLVLSGHYAEGIQLFQNVLKTDPEFVQAYAELAQAYQLQGSYTEALAELDKIPDPGDFPFVFSERGLIFALQGKRQEALEMLQKIQDISTRRRPDPRYIANIYFALGDKDSGFRVLERAYEDHDPEIVMLKGGPTFDSIRSDPRYLDLIHRLRLA